MPSFGAKLTVTDNLIVSEIDNKTIEHSFFQDEAVFALTQGEHAIILHYKDVFEDIDFAQERVVKSEDFVIRFSVSNEQELHLSTKKISNLVSAEKFVKSPQLMLKDEHHKQLGITLENVSDYKLAQQVNQVVNTLTTKQSSQPKVPTQVKQSINLPKETTVTKQVKVVNSNVQVNAVTMLNYWWQRASKQEQQDFINTTLTETKR